MTNTNKYISKPFQKSKSIHRKRMNTKKYLKLESVSIKTKKISLLKKLIYKDFKNCKTIKQISLNLIQFIKEII